jgi:thioredoxin
MPEVTTLTDANWQSHIGSQPALILLSSGEGLRGDFVTQFKKSAAESKTLIFAQIDPTKNPQIAQQFGAGEKPLLIGWYKQNELFRRVRPWGSDVVLSVELLEKTFRDDPETAQPVVIAPASTAINGKDNKMAEIKPVVVTDATFQKEVIDYSQETPVLVDFWAEWCPPCKAIAPIMEKLAEEYAGQVRIAKVDTDANPGLSQYFRIMSIPTIMAVKQGVIVFNQAGALRENNFRELISQLIALQIPAQGEQEAETQPEN